jgi:hypothetical protein
MGRVRNVRKGEGRAGHRKDSDNVVQEGEGLLTIRSKFKAYITCKGKGKETGSFLTLQTNYTQKPHPLNLTLSTHPKGRPCTQLGHVTMYTRTKGNCKWCV